MLQNMLNANRFNVVIIKMHPTKRVAMLNGSSIMAACSMFSMMVDH